jgi:NADPH-dependent 2,4-dienoyl-CoA reductase/sulfur reductase-like enzyme
MWADFFFEITEDFILLRRDLFVFCPVLVVGGGGLGMEAVRALIGADILVAAYQREEKFDIPEMFHDDIEEMGWDVIDVATIEKVLEAAPFKAIVCTVGELLAWCSIPWTLAYGWYFHVYF